MNIIELKNIDTIYEGEKIPAIYNINFSVKRGEFVTVIGPNGAGKTTLLETINGILPYTSGEGYVFNKEIKRNKEYIRKKTGYVIQNFEIDPLAPFLCRDIVMTGRAGKLGLFRFPGETDWQIVRSMMDLLGVKEFERRPVGKLSGGEFQKILLARALAQEPELLLLDEPFSNLDIYSRRNVEDILSELNEKNNVTIVMVSHDLNMIPVNCSRILVMDKGRIILDAKSDNVDVSDLIEIVFNKSGNQ